MAVTIKTLPPVEDDGKEILTVKVVGKLEVEDYEALVPELERLLEARDKIDLLVQLVDFGGWSAGAAWEDTKLGVRHFHDIARLAIVGESLWEQGMTLFARPFTAARVRYFDVADTGEAIAWLRG
jgi:hypothetical protein